MADVHFRVPYGLESPHRYFGVPESYGKGVHRGIAPWSSVQRSGLIIILGKLNDIVNCRVPMADSQYCDQTRSFNASLWISPPVYSLALRLRNNKVPVWTHESIGYPKMDISHWDAAIHFGAQLAQYCDQTRSCNATLRRSAPVYSLALRLRNSKVPVWTHESIGYPKMDISHWDPAIHYGVQLVQYCDQTRPCNASLWISPPVYSHALRLRNTKVPVWTHESIGYPKIDICQWDAAIRYGVQLAQ